METQATIERYRGMALESRAASCSADNFRLAESRRVATLQGSAAEPVIPLVPGTRVTTVTPVANLHTALTLAHPRTRTTAVTFANPATVTMPCGNSTIWFAGDVFGGDKHAYQRLKNRSLD